VSPILGSTQFESMVWGVTSESVGKRSLIVCSANHFVIIFYSYIQTKWTLFL
jgi:hypothetical protein